jgi:chemotaxis protein CheX
LNRHDRKRRRNGCRQPKPDSSIGCAAALLDEEPGTFTEVEGDAVGELANMIAGGAKTQMQELSLSIGLPSIICGKHHPVGFPAGATPILIPFVSDWGPISSEVGIVLV